MLENKILDMELEEVTEREEGFKITDLEGANWAFRKLRAIKHKQDEISHVAKLEKDRIQRWEDEEKKVFEGDKVYFEGLLENFYKEQKAKDDKFKLSTPHGKVSSRKSKSWVWEDENKLLEYVKENNIPALRVKEEIKKDEIKKIFKDGVNTETGEILPYVVIETKESITIKAE